jgi:hypothetical protein
VNAHVSDLQWDRLLMGELSAGTAAREIEHAAACVACGTRLRMLRAEHAAFGHRPIPGGLRSALRRASWRRAALLVPVLAAAAAVLIVRERVEPPEQAKGHGPALVVAAGRPGALTPLTNHDAIHPGQYLQAVYTAARDGFGAVLSRDGAGSVVAYVPASGDAMIALPAGVEQSFPHSTILDGVTGGERVVIVWCEAPHALAPLLARLRDGVPIAPPDGCTARELMLTKEVRR